VIRIRRGRDRTYGSIAWLGAGPCCCGSEPSPAREMSHDARRASVSPVRGSPPISTAAGHCLRPSCMACTNDKARQGSGLLDGSQQAVLVRRIFGIASLQPHSLRFEQDAQFALLIGVGPQAIAVRLSTKPTTPHCLRCNPQRYGFSIESTLGRILFTAIAAAVLA
jgi:hypothetical protein